MFYISTLTYPLIHLQAHGAMFSSHSELLVLCIHGLNIQCFEYVDTHIIIVTLIYVSK